MLEELNIADFAIIDKVTVRLEPGFNVLTGETGAGKSIIIDAVSAVLGGRTSSEVVRTGTKGARVEAVFSLEDEVYAEVARALTDYELFDEGEENESLILSREISATGRSTARINGRPVPASVLAQIGEMLVDIHGQSEHLSLFKVAGHVDLLDRYAGTGEQRRALAELVGRLRRVQAEEDRLREARRDAARRLDLLNYQVEEITAGSLRPEEEEEIEAERTVLANADRLATLANIVVALLSGGEDEGSEISALDMLNRASLSLSELARIDASQAPLLESLQTALYGVEEAARDLTRYMDNIDADPARLAQLEERTSLLQQLKRKYGDTIEEVIAYGERAATEQAELLGAEDRLEELAAEAEALRDEIGRAGAALSTLRRTAADDLARRVEGQLADLAMSRARFAVSIDWRPEPRGVPVPGWEGRVGYDETGLDRVEFLISPNPGEALKPLARIASGGEASRLMLALKTILSEVDHTPTLIFDEVDTGVGGRSGGVVGEKLRDLGRQHQVICITHLPQVAALGDLQLRIEKQIVGDRTRTAVYPLEGQDRVDEIASMIGGTPVSASARQSALDLLARGREQTAGAC